MWEGPSVSSHFDGSNSSLYLHLIVFDMATCYCLNSYLSSNVLTISKFCVGKKFLKLLYKWSY